MIPSTVTVGPYRISIVIDQAAIDRASVQHGGELAGSYNSSQCRIALKPDMHPDYQAETLLHEIIHAAFEVAGKPFGDADEERAVGCLAPVLLDTLRRNLDVVGYLMCPDSP